MCKNGKAILGFGTLQVIGKGFVDGVEKFVIAPKKDSRDSWDNNKETSFSFLYLWWLE